MKKNFYFVLALFSFYSFTASAQQSSVPTRFIGINYSSSNTYAGRDFGVSEFVVSPFFKYKSHAGLYGMISGNWLSNNNPRYSSTNLELGYEKNISSFFTLTASYDKLFVNTTDSTPSQPISNSLNVNTSLTYRFLSLNLGYSYEFGNETGQAITAGLSASFSKDLDDFFINSISFNPGINSILGNTNIVFKKLSISQYQKGIGKYKIRQVGKTKTTGNSTVVTSNPFGLLSYELNLPISFDIKNLNFTIAYNYVIPNKLDATEDSGLTNSGYITAGVTYSF
jgi:hypothetical protein